MWITILSQKFLTNYWHFWPNIDNCSTPFSHYFWSFPKISKFVTKFQNWKQIVTFLPNCDNLTKFVSTFASFNKNFKNSRNFKIFDLIEASHKRRRRERKPFGLLKENSQKRLGSARKLTSLLPRYSSFGQNTLKIKNLYRALPKTSRIFIPC